MIFLEIVKSLIFCPGKILRPNGEQQTLTIPSSWQVLKSQISCLSISKLIGWTPIIEFFLDEQIVLMHWLFLQKEDLIDSMEDELFIFHTIFRSTYNTRPHWTRGKAKRSSFSSIRIYLNIFHKWLNMDKFKNRSDPKVRKYR